MLTRRRFLSYSGSGILAITAGCRPANFNLLPNQEEAPSNIIPSLAAKAKLSKLKNLLLGYPVKNLRQSRRLENVNRSKRVKLCTT
jgi:histidine decarboxylase